MLYYAQEEELDVFLPVTIESSLPAFTIWLHLQNKSSFSSTVFLSQLRISPPLCHLLFALTTTVTVSCACHLLPEYYEAVIIGHSEIYSYRSKTFICCQGWI